MASPDRCHAQHFVGGCYSGPTFSDAVIDHCGHPGEHSGLVDGIAIGLSIDKVAYALVDLENLEDANPSPIAGSAASLATFGFVDRFAGLEPERTEARIVREISWGQVTFRLAAIAKLA